MKLSEYFQALLLNAGWNIRFIKKEQPDEVDLEVIREKKPETESSKRTETRYLDLTNSGKSDKEIREILWNEGFTAGDIDYVASKLTSQAPKEPETIESNVREAEQIAQAELKATRKTRILIKVIIALIMLAITIYLLYPTIDGLLKIHAWEQEYGPCYQSECHSDSDCVPPQNLNCNSTAYCDWNLDKCRYH